jgi:general secretion pathway protein A
MYQDFYQLTANPFAITADPDFFFSSKSHADAISNLMYGIEQRKGILVITGEIGTGKTTLCRKLLKNATKKIKFALILNPNFSEIELLQIILHDLGIKTREKNKFALIYALNKFLIKQANKGYNVVVIIDEAQNLSVEQLEQIRLLSNLETEKEKLLQIILVGQPELEEKIKLPELRQLRQRIAVHFHIPPLEQKDIKNYINHRIQIAAEKPDAVRQIAFTDKAIELIYRYTEGFPRVINILCDRALLAGYTTETGLIDENIINNCAREVLYCEHYL